jgi:hypothetical protein
MAMRLGMENKRQVYLAASLFAIIAVIGAKEIFSSLGSHPSSRRPTAAANVASAQRAATPQSTSGFGLEPRLHLAQLAHNERVEYSAASRNIFSAASAPAPIEAPLAPARPLQVAAAAPPVPEKPAPPAIDLKYLGYALSGDKSYHALLARGDDSLMAKSGEIIFHRYKVGAIQPSTVQITDLSYNNTRTISVTEK